MCLAAPDSPAAQIADRAVAAAERHFARRLAAIRTAIEGADDFDAAGRALLELAARWTPDALAALLAQAMDLAALEGREAVFAESEAPAPGFAEPEFTRLDFAEQIAYLRQKRGKPTRAWTDAMGGDHDRAFVVAGVTDLAMLEEFQAAVIAAVETRDIKGFAAEFDRLVETYGWDYNGGRGWRIRTIFETNIRTSYMAGRLRQMRDPEVVKTRPYWQYLHADTRVPLKPRPEHVAWDGLVLRWDDPWWDTHFPPNDWRCSCGVRTLTERDLAGMGKDGPDTAPDDGTRTHTHKATGDTVQLPSGIGYGWDHMPGDLWERGLVPSALAEEAGALQTAGRHRVEIDTPVPIEALISAARPFRSARMAPGLDDETYISAFLEPFGATLDQAAIWTDATGTRLPISAEMFRGRDGLLKIRKRGREVFARQFAEVLRDPDEIWIGVAAKRNAIDPDVEELVVDRRYIRVDPDTGLYAVFEVGRRWWEAVTAYPTQDRKGQPTIGGIDKRRGGKLVWKRK
ncbi:Phage (Mu-like) virion morphogenesis protein [Rhodovulum sp. P5]|uniref:PBECR2 nuclease fold domain-containing protein n=1 Tax=Rhodovulum sp. P5 TaxID=1564506 RepID=UPI0009C2F359|nr:PBECR2 nuclease fold domain-containing protein [Rhodovulum sp. P5]ARE40900.1 Phage (Mu-like) virion morphogenesis protein [Rhodovulum sp. P5]